MPIYGVINCVLLISCFVASTVIGAPKHLYYAFRVSLTSPRYGPIAKTVGLLAIIPTVLLSIAVWFILLVLGWVVTTIGLPFIVTYGSEVSNLYRMDNLVWSHLTDVYHMYANTLTLQIRAHELPNPDGSVFELKIFRIFTGILIGAMGICIDTVIIGLCVAIKFIPVLFYTLFRLTRVWVNSDCAACCFIPFVVSLAGTCVIVPIGAALLCVAGALAGASTTITTFAHGERVGFYQIFTHVYHINTGINMLLGIETTIFSCWDYSSTRNPVEPSLPPLPPAYQARYTPPPQTQQIAAPSAAPAVISVVVVTPSAPPVPSAPPATRLSINHIWLNFFTMMSQVASELIRSGVADRDDITSYEPHALIGLPAVVVLKALLRTPYNTHHFELADGTYIDETTRPIDAFSTKVYEKMAGIKRDIAALGLGTNDINFLTKFLYTSDHSKCLTERKLITDDRMSALMKISSKITDIAIMITIVPTFQSNFAGVVRTI